jgi:RNA polymerase sigma-70 factor (ECF subfamily)
MTDELPSGGSRSPRRWPPTDDELAEHALRIALRTATAILGSRERASDVAQDVAIDVLRGINGLRNPETLDVWIHRIAVRHTMKALKRDRRRGTREMSLVDLPEALEPATIDSPSGRAERRESAREIVESLALLPDKQRTALVLRYVHDLSHEQIADAMGVRPGTAGALISRGRSALRQQAALGDTQREVEAHHE